MPTNPRKPRKAVKAKVVKANLYWAVFTLEGSLYSASNAQTRREAIMHHEASTGLLWDVCRRSGDRIRRITITVVK